MRRDCQRGYTLLEMLGYLAVLTILINLALSVFLSNKRLYEHGTRALDKMFELNTISRDFTKTVRESSGIEATLGSIRSGQKQVILRLAPSTDSQQVRRYAIFRRDPGGRRLSKLVVRQEDEDLTSEEFTTYPADLGACHFEYDATELQEARRIALVLDTKTVNDDRGKSVKYVFTAVPRALSPGGEMP